jgi:hypothetical protein
VKEIAPFSTMSLLFGDPSSFLLNGYREPFPGVKQPRCEAKHSPPFPETIKNEWRYTCTSSYDVMADAGGTLQYFINNFNMSVFKICYLKDPNRLV